MTKLAEVKFVSSMQPSDLDTEDRALFRKQSKSFKTYLKLYMKKVKKGEIEDLEYTEKELKSGEIIGRFLTTERADRVQADMQGFSFAM